MDSIVATRGGGKGNKIEVTKLAQAVQYTSGMSAFSLLVAVCFWSAIVAGPALFAVKVVRGAQANKRAQADRTRNYRPGPKTYTI